MDTETSGDTFLPLQDNPSYFSLRSGEGSSNGSATTSGNAQTSRGFGSFFRRSKVTNTPSKSSRYEQPKSRSGTSAGSQRRSFRNLFRSASGNTDCQRTIQFLKGEPRPSDVAPPSPYLNTRSIVHSENGRSKSSRRRVLKSTSELLNMDMVFCGLSPEAHSVGGNLPRRTEDNDYYCFERDSDCGSEATTLPIDDVEDNRSYYNLTSTLPNMRSSKFSNTGERKHHQRYNSLHKCRQRRHSIGTFLERDTILLAAASHNQPASLTDQGVESITDKTNSWDIVDTIDDCSKMTRVTWSDAHGTRHAAASYASKPSEEATAPTKDDVIFISSKDNEASALWVNYLSACFEQISRQQGRPPFKVSQVALEDPVGPRTELKIRSSRLQIVVICPVFLERVSERPDQAATITRQLGAERVLTMMLGVQDSHLTETHRASLVTYQNWRKFFVKDQDETFVGQLLGAAVAILGNTNTNHLKIDKTGFSVHPKKVKLEQGQNRVIALLNEPLHPDDQVNVIVDRCGEAIELSHVKRRNPYTLQFSIPERCLDVSMLVGVRISRNGTALGVRQIKCESRLRELDQILRAHDNPLEFMCQTFGFNSGDKEQLDTWMVHAFQKNIPPHFNLFCNPPGGLQISKNHSGSEENPTLLHFAARFGLEKLAWQLLECPGGDIACDMRNINDLTPADLAEYAGHARLAHQLRGYMQMNEFSNMYSYLKVMSESTNGNTNGYQAPNHQFERVHLEEDQASWSSRQEDYCRPRPLSEAYSVPPTARPVTTIHKTFPDYSTPPPLPQPNAVPREDSSFTVESERGTPAAFLAYSSTSTLNASNLELPLQGYMHMNPAGMRSPDSAASTPTLMNTSSSVKNTVIDGKSECGETMSDQSSTKSSLGRSSQSSSKSRECPQDELLEIITDFKNNVFTISEVERLVENWRNRNDVQQSFKDKQRQLSAMRDEYERIQKRIKEEMKAPTPFDRIRKLFTKGKKDSKDPSETNDDVTPNKHNGNLGDRRPVSSLSLHSVSSSSSSGRMSTVSGCSGTSLGDSGTHSDTDDRRLQHSLSEEKAVGITSYEIPPAPKPFHGRSYPQHQHQHQHQHQQQEAGSNNTSNTMRAAGPSGVSSSELDLRPVKSSHSTLDDKEYYIAFPPSGLPIHSFKPGSEGKSSSSHGTPLEPREPRNSNESHGKFTGNGNYANVTPRLEAEAAGIQYGDPKETDKPEVLTIQPEIHPEPKSNHRLDYPSAVGNVDTLPDYTNVQLEASDEIARNFGVTLKKLPAAPTVPLPAELNFPPTETIESANN